MPLAYARAERLLLPTTLCVGIVESFAIPIVWWSGREDVWTPEIGFWLYWLLLLTWVYFEAKCQDIFRPYDFGLILVLFAPLYLPYYFIKTRRARGLLMFVGLCLLPYLGTAVVIAAWLAQGLD